MKSHRSRTPPKVTNTHRRENHQILQFSILLRCQNDLLKTVSCSRRFVFVCLLWGPWGRYACSAKHLHLRQPSPPGAQTPRSLCSCTATTPKEHFNKIKISTLPPSSRVFQTNLISIKYSSKKHASQFPTCRGGLGEALYNNTNTGTKTNNANNNNNNNNNVNNNIMIILIIIIIIIQTIVIIILMIIIM